MSRKSWRAVKDIRIADVARLAGVSTATVSRVLSDPDKVRKKTHDVVMEAVRRSGYTPNSTAQNLRTRRTMNVLVVAPRLTNPVFAEILRGVDDELTKSGYGIIIGNLDNRREREARYVDRAAAFGSQRVMTLDHVVAARAHRCDVGFVLPEPLYAEAVGLRFVEIAVGEIERIVELGGVAHLLLHIRRRRLGRDFEEDVAARFRLRWTCLRQHGERDRCGRRLADGQRRDRDAALVLRLQTNRP